MSSQQQEINEYIKHRRNDLWYQHYPEDYEVVRKWYDIFSCGDELFEYTRYDIMCEEIENYIDSFIDEFKEKYSIICKYLEPYQIKILSFYYSDCKDDELYKMCKVRDLDKIEEKNNELYRLKLCEYIVDHICNFI